MCNTGGDTTFQITHMSFPNTKYIILNTKHMIANSKYIIPNTISTFQKTKYSLPDIDTIKARCISSIHRSMCNTGGDKSTSISNSRSYVKYKIHYPKYKIEHCKYQPWCASSNATQPMAHSRWHILCHNKSLWSHFLCGEWKEGGWKKLEWHYMTMSQWHSITRRH